MSRPAAWPLALALLLSAACAREEAPSKPAASPSASVRPNIIFVLMDAVRADHVPAYGYPREKMPFLARLGEGGPIAKASDE